MSSRNFKKALREAETTKSQSSRVVVEPRTDEEIREAAFQSRRNKDANMPQKMADDNTRSQLLREAGFDWVDIEELQPHPKNEYHISEEDVEVLAGLIYLSKETEPLIVRETQNGLQIIDGERRWRAHKLLSEMYGDIYRMVPVRIHSLESRTEEEVEFILHSNNAGQRKMTPSENAMGYAVVAEKLVEWRESNPNLKGVKTKTMLAEYFGVSERTAQKNLTIGRGLISRCGALLDEKKLTIEQAETVARLPEEQQEDIADALEASSLSAQEVDVLIEKVKNGEDLSSASGQEAPITERKKKDVNGHLKSARNSLKRASRYADPASYKLLGEIKELVRVIEEIQEERERRTNL